MRRYLFALACVLSMAWCGAEAAQREAGRLADIRARIVSLNLLNGLELTGEQMRVLLDAARRAEEVRERVRKLISQDEGEAIAVYENILERAKKGSTPVPREIVRRFRRLQERKGRVRAEARDELSRLAARVRESLEPHQVYTIEKFKPCIIPPVEKGLVGQADESKALGKMLVRVRYMPEEIYRRRKERIMERAVVRAKAKAPPDMCIDEGKLRRDLSRAMESARAMSDIDFLREADTISRDLEEAFVPKRRPVALEAKIQRFLLSPEVIPLLEERTALK